MSPKDFFFFFQLCALRIANSPAGCRSRNLGTYRTLVRQYAEAFGIRTEIETGDEPMIDALDLLWEEGYVGLNKYDSRFGWTDRFQYANKLDFYWWGDFQIELTLKGRKLLADMESKITTAQPINSRYIRFHAAVC